MEYKIGTEDEDEDEDILVPLVYCMVVDEYRFDLNSAQESLIQNSTVVDIESDDRSF